MECQVQQSSIVNSLPSPPTSLSYEDVSLRFVKCLPGDTEKGFVPNYHFRILNQDGLDVGHLNVRVGDTEHIRLAAGNIGYGITAAHRGNGYAAQACHAAANWVATLMDEILLTVDLDNPASIRTIEKIGAQFIRIVDVPKGDPHHERGIRQKRLYIWDPSARL